MAMNRLERWLLVLWIVTSAWTLMAFIFWGLTSLAMLILAFTGIAFPLALLLWWLPALALHLTIGVPIYFSLRRLSRSIAMIASLAMTGVLMIIIPAIANSAQENRIAGVTKNDGGGPIALMSGQTVARLYDWGDNFDWDRGCEEDCQRLLFSGAASAVILGDTDALKGPTKLKRYWLGPAHGPCPKARYTPVYASDLDVGKDAPYPRPRLYYKLLDLQNEGLCLYESNAKLDEADVILARWYHPVAKSKAVFADRLDLSLMAGTSYEAIAIYRRSGSKLFQTMRQSSAAARSLSIPLMLKAPFVFDTISPGGWSRGAQVRAGQRPNFGLQVFLTNDLRVRGLESWM